MRALPSIGLRLRGGPLDRIDEDLPYFRPIVIVVGFVAGREVKNFALPDGPAQAHASGRLAAIRFGIDAVKRNGFRRGHSKWFAVTLDQRQLKVLYSFADRVIRFFDGNGD